MYKNNPQNSSWNKVAGWYQKITQDGGHYYHRNIIIPNVLKLLNLKGDENLLDLGCGNGVLGKSLPNSVKYTGIDLADNLIKSAKFEDKNKSHNYYVADITKPLNLPEDFDSAVIILALQNVERPDLVIKNASLNLKKDGKFVIVLNHPMFRIPRQSSWGIDESRKIQYRRIDKYMSPMNIPILMNPSDKSSEETISYHNSLSEYSKMLKDNGFVIELIEEWTSDKESFGTAKKMEDRARTEIPLFMAISTKKADLRI